MLIPWLLRTAAATTSLADSSNSSSPIAISGGGVAIAGLGAVLVATDT
jgi:hypothetical protein